MFCSQCASPVAVGAKPPADPLLAKLERSLGSQFEIMRLLGRGGMGAVYLAREYSLDRLVAIKVLLPDATAAESGERFRREARTAAKLTHPNIVPLLTFGEADGMMYFVMGFVQGESLKSRIERKGKIDPDEARRILGDIAGALHYAHEQGVVHRDVKPDNILIDDENGKPLLTDFGIAQSVASGDTLTQVGTTLGTPHYMSPEQASGERDIDGRSDLYSLGVIGYEMLSGRLPFEGDNLREVLVQHVTKDPVPLTNLEPSIPEDLARTISKCLEKEPDKRIADGQGFKLALGSVGADDEELSMELETSIGEVRRMGVFSALCFYGGFLTLVFGADSVKSISLFGFGVMGLTPLIAAWVSIKKGIFGAREFWYWALAKPKWWILWWPKRWRHPNDMWDRFPEQFKTLSTLNWSSIPVTLTTVPFVVRGFIDAWPGDPAPYIWILLATATVPGLASIGLVARFQRWLKKNGLNRKDMMKWEQSVNRPDSAFWKQPHIQRLLQPREPLTKIEPSVPQTSEGYLSALSSFAKEFDGAKRLLTDDAVSAARDILRVIEAVDSQIGHLASSFDPAEVARYKQRLDALGDPDEPEPASKKKMRDMFGQQLELAQDLGDQLEEARERRARLLTMLETLWLQISNLKARSAAEGFDTSEISRKVRAIAEDVQRYQEASEETVMLLEPEIINVPNATGKNAGR